MTLPATPGNPVVGVLTYQTLQIPGTLGDWMGPAFDRSNPQVFNAHLMPPVEYGTTLLIPWNLKNDFRIYIPVYQDVTDAQWRRDVWRGAAYDLNAGVCWVCQLTDSVLPGHLEHRYRQPFRLR